MAPSFWFSSTSSCTSPVTSAHAAFAELPPLSSTASGSNLLSLFNRKRSPQKCVGTHHSSSFDDINIDEIMCLLRAVFHFASTPGTYWKK